MQEGWARAIVKTSTFGRPSEKGMSIPGPSLASMMGEWKEQSLSPESQTEEEAALSLLLLLCSTSVTAAHHAQSKAVVEEQVTSKLRCG